jgi:biopolymer transport protein ExbD
MAGGGGGEGEPEFQVAPMVDVLLTILIFFMTITSAQVLRVDKTIKLPVAPNAQKKDNTKAECIINVRWKPATQSVQYVFDDRVYPRLEDLVPVLKARHDADPKYRGVIRGDRDAPAVAISRVMDVLGQSGISDVSFSAVNKE